MRLAVGHCALVHLLLGVAFAQANADDAPKPPGAIRVAVYDDTGVGKSLRELIKVLDGFCDVRSDRIRAEDIRDGRLADYDVLIHPGGSGSKQAKHLGEEGRATPLTSPDFKLLRVVKDKVDERVDPARTYPLVGDAAYHHRIYRCVVVGTYRGRPHVNVVYIDHNNLHLTDDE